MIAANEVKVAQMWRPSGKVFAAAGHRPNKLAQFRVSLLRYLADRHCKYTCPSAMISGMAQGWDMVWAETALDLGVPLICAIPYDGHAGSLPAAERRRYFEILEAAAEVKIVSEGGYAIWKFQVRNKWMVDNSDEIVALWNGSDGGTANCIQYANKKSKPVTNLWEQLERW